METKACKCCGQSLPHSSYRTTKSKNGQEYLRGVCIPCDRERSKAFEAANKERRLAEKRQRYAANPEKERERGRRFYQENADKEKARSQRWRESNRDSLREYYSRYAKENASYCVFKVQKRHAAKLQRTPPWLTEEHLKDIRTEYELAAWCSEVMGIKYNVDHIVPLQGKMVSGLHVPWNLRVIPATDNFKKGNKFHGD